MVFALVRDATLMRMPMRLRTLATTPGPLPGHFAIVDPAPKVAYSRQCRDRIVHLGHPWENTTPALLTVLEAESRREWIVPRAFEGHVMAVWLDGTTLSMVISEPHDVTRGAGIVEANVRGATAKVGPLQRLGDADRHLGKGHAELSLQTVMRHGEHLFAIARAGTNQAVLELELTGGLYTARVLLLAKSDQAMFSDDGEYVVLHQCGKTTTIVGLDGRRLATVTAPVAKGTTSYVSTARNGSLGYTIFHAGDQRSWLEIATEPWPASTTHELAEVPDSLPIANLMTKDAPACSPEPIAYATAATQPAAFGAVIGWALNADPKTAKPTVTHVIVTDTILNFFDVAERRLRFRFNFSLAAITAMKTKPRGSFAEVEILTPSGRTVLHATRELAAALERSASG